MREKSAGIKRAETQGEALREQLAKGNGDANLHVSAYKGTAAEQLAFWKTALPDRGQGNSAKSHLPNLQITDTADNRVVKDGSGRVIYDQAKVRRQAEDDASIHRGEGPYSALR